MAAYGSHTPNHVCQIAVGGCEHYEPDDPGNLQFDWLEVQLKMFRKRGVQVPKKRSHVLGLASMTNFHRFGSVATYHRLQAIISQNVSVPLTTLFCAHLDLLSP